MFKIYNVQIFTITEGAVIMAQKRANIPPTAVDEYVAGTNINQLSKKYGVSFITMKRYLREQGAISMDSMKRGGELDDKKTRKLCAAAVSGASEEEACAAAGIRKTDFENFWSDVGIRKSDMARAVNGAESVEPLEFVKDGRVLPIIGLTKEEYAHLFRPREDDGGVSVLDKTTRMLEIMLAREINYAVGGEDDGDYSYDLEKGYVADEDGRIDYNAEMKAKRKIEHHASDLEKHSKRMKNILEIQAALTDAIRARAQVANLCKIGDAVGDADKVVFEIPDNGKSK